MSPGVPELSKRDDRQRENLFAFSPIDESRELPVQRFSVARWISAVMMSLLSAIVAFVASVIAGLLVLSLLGYEPPAHPGVGSPQRWELSDISVIVLALFGAPLIVSILTFERVYRMIRRS